MRISDVEARFARPISPSSLRPSHERGRPAAVLIPVYECDGDLRLIFTRRSDDVPTHKGQISFPGGTWKEGDVDLEATVRREVEEEIGVPGDQVRILAALESLVTITSFHVTPFVGTIPGSCPLVPEEREIAQILRVPLAHLADPRNQRVMTMPYRGAEREVYFFDWPPHVIWGATGRILRAFLDLIEKERPA